MLTTVQRLADAGALKKWGVALPDLPERRSVLLGEGQAGPGAAGCRCRQQDRGAAAALFYQAIASGPSLQYAHSRPPLPRPAGELRLVGVSQPEKIAQISVRNDAAFLWSTVGVTSVIALVLGQLPGDWGFFSAYLAGERGGACASGRGHHVLRAERQPSFEAMAVHSLSRSELRPACKAPRLLFLLLLRRRRHLSGRAGHRQH